MPALKCSLLAAIAVVCVYYCVDWAITSHRSVEAFDEAKVAEPINETIDLAPTKQFPIKYHHTYRRSHGLTLYLASVDPAAPPPTGSLIGKLTIIDPAGAEAETTHLTTAMADFQSWSPPRGLRIGYIFSPSFPTADYSARLEVDTVSFGLRGPVRLMGQYDLCGCELYAPILMAAFSVVCGLAGLVVGVWAYYRARKLG